DAEALWTARGPSGKACADCHEGGAASAMRGFATQYPKFVKSYHRVMSLEDWLEVHAPERTGQAMPSESADHLAMPMLVKRASDGMPVGVDVTSPEARAGLARGKETFYCKVCARNDAVGACRTARHT